MKNDRKKVLVVDDEVKILEVIKAFLKQRLCCLYCRKWQAGFFYL